MLRLWPISGRRPRALMIFLHRPTMSAATSIPYRRLILGNVSVRAVEVRYAMIKTGSKSAMCLTRAPARR